MVLRGRYTGSNPDPNPPIPVDNPNTLSRRRQRFTETPGTPSYSKSLLSEFSRSIEDKIVDGKIHEVLLRSENEELIGIILDLQKRGIDTSSLVSQKDKEEFWEVVTSELLLERED